MNAVIETVAGDGMFDSDVVASDSVTGNSVTGDAAGRLSGRPGPAEESGCLGCRRCTCSSTSACSRMGCTPRDLRDPDGVPLPVSTVRRLCCEAEIVPVVLGSDGEVLDVGRTERTANRAQRRALRAMHRTCAHPDCTVGFSACRIHHVKWWWEHNGPTDIDNLLPLCERHHHVVHEGGWTLTMTPDRVVTWIRPDGVVYWTGSSIDRTSPKQVAARRGDLGGSQTAGRAANPAWVHRVVAASS